MAVFAGNILENGYEIVPDVFASGEMDGLIVELAELPRSRAGMRHLMGIEGVARLANDARMMQLARSIVGEGAQPFRASLFDKSNDANWLVVWHQDTALPLRERLERPGWGPWSVKEGVTYAHAPASALAEVVALRVHLDDSTEKNGPLRVLAGTHTSGVLSDVEIEREVGKREAFACTVERGGVVMMRPLAVHASSKSTSVQPRRVLHVEYASEELARRVELALA